MRLNINAINPKSLEDFLFGKTYEKSLLEDILNGILLFPSAGRAGICLHGTFGTGKTTLALMLPKLLDESGFLRAADRGNCFQRSPIYDLTLCKAGNESIAQISAIADRVDSRQSFSKSGWHFEVLDEADLLTDKAQDMLKSLMTFNKDTIFIMTTNFPSKFSKGLQDRCHMVEMNAATDQQLVRFGKILLQRLSLDERLIPEDELLAYAKTCKGSLREFNTAVLRTASRNFAVGA